jgi:hypothetical protein
MRGSPPSMLQRNSKRLRSLCTIVFALICYLTYLISIEDAALVSNSHEIVVFSPSPDNVLKDLETKDAKTTGSDDGLTTMANARESSLLPNLLANKTINPTNQPTQKPTRQPTNAPTPPPLPCPIPVRVHSSGEPNTYEPWEPDLRILSGGANRKAYKSVYFPLLISLCCKDKIFRRIPAGFDTSVLEYHPIVNRTFADVVFRSAECTDWKREYLVAVVRKRVEAAGFTFKVSE